MWPVISEPLSIASRVPLNPKRRSIRTPSLYLIRKESGRQRSTVVHTAIKSTRLYSLSTQKHATKARMRIVPFARLWRRRRKIIFRNQNIPLSFRLLSLSFRFCSVQCAIRWNLLPFTLLLLRLPECNADIYNPQLSAILINATRNRTAPVHSFCLPTKRARQWGKLGVTRNPDNGPNSVFEAKRKWCSFVQKTHFYLYSVYDTSFLIHSLSLSHHCSDWTVLFCKMLETFARNLISRISVSIYEWLSYLKYMLHLRD